MRYMSLETMSHLAISDLSREAVKKHQEVVLKALKVRFLMEARNVVYMLLVINIQHDTSSVVFDILSRLRKTSVYVSEQ